MKNGIIKNTGYLIVILVFSLLSLGFKFNTLPVDDSIVGTWVSRDDSGWRLVFTTDNKCYDYSGDQLDITYTYTISNTSPQCGELVTVNAKTSFLQLTDIQNSNNKICFEIHSLEGGILTLRKVDRGGFTTFNKQ